MQFDEIVPWGRNFDEYRAMFALADADLSGAILGCGDGPASFNAEGTARGLKITSLDPLYVYSKATIEARIAMTFDIVLAQVRENASQFTWVAHKTPESLGRTRSDAMGRFIADYDAGLAEGRYVHGALPALPFEAGVFDLALCSNLLFLYSTHIDLPAHLAAIRELLRVAREVRIFPLITLTGERSPFVMPVTEAMRDEGFDVAELPTQYEFYKGGTTMLQMSRAR